MIAKSIDDLTLTVGDTVVLAVPKSCKAHNKEYIKSKLFKVTKMQGKLIKLAGDNKEILTIGLLGGTKVYLRIDMYDGDDRPGILISLNDLKAAMEQIDG